MDKPTIDLATSRQLIAELVNRPTLRAVVVYLDQEITTTGTLDKPSFVLEVSDGLSQDNVADFLRSALSAFLKATEADE